MPTTPPPPARWGLRVPSNREMLLLSGLVLLLLLVAVVVVRNNGLASMLERELRAALTLLSKRRSVAGKYLLDSLVTEADSGDAVAFVSQLIFVNRSALLVLTSGGFFGSGDWNVSIEGCTPTSSCLGRGRGSVDGSCEAPPGSNFPSD